MPVLTENSWLGFSRNADHPAVGVVEHAVADVHRLPGDHHRERGIVVAAVGGEEVLELQVGVDVGVGHEEGRLQPLPEAG